MLRAAIVAVAFGVTGLWSVSADACSCVVPGLPCEAAWRSDVVFSGRVVSLESSAARTGSHGVEFEVIETFSGPDVRTIVVGSGGGCSYSFKIGESYLVYATEVQGTLTTSVCTRTRPLRDATDDLAYARSLSAVTPGLPARIGGTVQIWEPRILVNGDPRPMAGKRPPKPVPHVMVTATGEGGVFSARTNARGEYELTGLPLGKYEISPAAPDGYQSVSRAVELFDPRGCGRTDLIVKSDGRVTGRVVDGSGRPVPGLPLALVLPADVNKRGGGSIRFAAWTAANGAFEVPLVPPGEYLLGTDAIVGPGGQLTFPRAFYPGAIQRRGAENVIVPAGERVQLRDFVVPETITLVTVKGTVVDTNGRPQPARIVLRDDTEGPNMIGPALMTGNDGSFTFSLVPGARYELIATRDAGTGAETGETHMGRAVFEASAAARSMTVVMKPPSRFWVEKTSELTKPQPDERTPQESAQLSPRRFRFVTTAQEYEEALYERARREVLEVTAQDFEKRGKGTLELWITGYGLSDAGRDLTWIAAWQCVPATVGLRYAFITSMVLAGQMQSPAAR
jgi:hypothetical protein